MWRTDDMATILGVRSFSSTIAGDDRTLASIFRELEHRGACSDKDRRPLAVIVSEQDTLYGRHLDDISRTIAQGDTRDGKCIFDIRSYGYLRGVDGETPPANGVGGDDRTRASDGNGGKPIAYPTLPQGEEESSSGPAQLDYIRRLSDRIASDPEAERLVAIGVLGTDIYDKLLILQALRARRPGVVFFTLDLDARLLEPAVLGVTRNMIVAAPDNVTVDMGERYYTFRDSYQTAMFRAVAEVVAPSSTFVIQKGPVSLFEIGRHSAIDLEGELETQRPHKWGAVALVAPLIGLCLFGVAMYLRMDKATAAIRRWWYGVVAVVAAGAAVLMYVYITRVLMKHEPWPLLEGVSSVPKISLEITTAIFALAIVAFAHGRTNHASGRVAAHVGESHRLGGEWTRVVDEVRTGWLRVLTASRRGWTHRNVRMMVPGQFWSRLRGCLIWTWMHDLGAEDRQSGHGVEFLWREYEQYSRWWRRLARIVVRTVLGVVFAAVFLASISEEQPLLASAELRPSGLVWWLRLMFFAAIFYCSDTLNMWRAFVRGLGDVKMWAPKNDGTSSEVVTRGEDTMNLLVQCSGLIGPIVVLPLLLMVLAVLGWSTAFEGTNTTSLLVMFYVGFAAYIIWSAISFQREASNARESLVEYMLDAQIREDSENEARKVGLAIGRIRARRDGAFVPWTQHPVLQTLAVPLGTVAVVTLLEMFVAPR